MLLNHLFGLRVLYGRIMIRPTKHFSEISAILGETNNSIQISGVLFWKPESEMFHQNQFGENYQR